MPEGFQTEDRPQAPMPEAPVQRLQNGGQGQGPVIDATPVAPPVETQPPPAPVETWPIRVKLLHKAIRNNTNEVIRELTFREPTGGDINRYGNPCRINIDGDVVIDEAKMTRVMAALSGILPPLLEVMDPRDWNSCAYRLRGFFLPEVAAW
jgi:tail assembly chaperone E/41/14-like protein